MGCSVIARIQLDTGNPIHIRRRAAQAWEWYGHFNTAQALIGIAVATIPISVVVGSVIGVAGDRRSLLAPLIGFSWLLTALALALAWRLVPQAKQAAGAVDSPGTGEDRTPPLDVRVDILNAQTALVTGNEFRLMGGWLYIADLRFTNREPHTVSLAVDLLVKLQGEARTKLQASDTPAVEVDDWLHKTKKLTELGPIQHVKHPVIVEPNRSVSGHLSFLLPASSIPRRGASFLEEGEILSEYAPDSHSLNLEDLVSNKVRRLEDWDGFRLQEKMNRFRRLRELFSKEE
jgi:hypothetical protein